MDYTAQSAANDQASSFNLQFAFCNDRFAIRFLPLAIFSVCFFFCSSALAQDRSTPSLMYFADFGLLYDGNYQDALKAFQLEGRNCIKSGTARWIDSICYHAMVGECYYQMGMLDKALDAYTEALRLYAIYPDWMMRMNFSPSIRAAGVGSRKLVPWGMSKRQSQIGYFPASVLMSQGKTQAENEQAVKQGGVIQQAILYKINPQEIIRCTALAMRRRAELLGPLCKHDALTADLVSKTTSAIGPPNHWSECWADLERGLAYLAAGRDSQAVPYLQRAVLAAGEFDHPLTCVALFELGRLALEQSDYKAAANYFEEATYAAVNFGDYGVLEEAFRYAALTHLMGNQQGLCPLLQPAAAWSKLKALRASIGLSLAENLAVAGQTREAAVVLDDVRAAVGRRNMAAGRVGARLNYLSAVVLFQERKLAEGQKALDAALAYMKRGSHWLFHIGLTEAYYLGVGGRAEGSRTALELYSNVLRDPQPKDWATDPLESLAVLTTPHSPAYEHWFESAIQRKEIQDTAMEITDRAKRHRFYNSLSWGGRLASLRWLLEAPADWLDRPAALQRQDILTRYPQYAKLAEESQKLRQKLQAMPLQPDDKAVLREQAAALAELASVASKQEAVLREIAVRREPADMAFPPLRKTQDLKKLLPDGHAVLAFYSTNRRTYAFLMNNTKYSGWEVTSMPLVSKQIVAMLRDMGLFAAVGELPLKDIKSDKWKASAEKVLDLLTKKSPADFSKPFQELVIVPDGLMWYLPFEALQVRVEGKLQPLISRFRIRYAPTLSLALSPYPPARRASGNAAVVWGKLPSRDEEDALKSAREKFESTLSGLTPLKTPPATSSIYSLMMNQLIVFDDLLLDDKDPYNWLPVPLDRNKSGGTLADWLGLPWGHPTEVFLSGFHTAAEDSLKRTGRNTVPGHEIFLNVCGLMSTGTRTILLSRWRTGGQTSYDLVREFAQELPHTSPADAWQRAVLLEIDARLNLAAEPRVKKSANDDSPKAEHPFFWAGYMLFDGGTPSDKPKAADEPVLKIKPPAAKPKPANPIVPPLMPGDKPKDEEKPAEKEKPKPQPAIEEEKPDVQPITEKQEPAAKPVTKKPKTQPEKAKEDSEQVK